MFNQTEDNVLPRPCLCGLTIGRQIDPSRSSRIIGNLTAIYGVGQIIGPVGAGALTNSLHTYSALLLLSGMLLLIELFY
ncbi:YbfB/YjiJ family MFS transporter [Paenibacillus alginolyticus]|uniref:YbfB/YjiJ family MFS transporter n=1 Tax=Paenibacillus alginolyticus TaxID=59839 RepID=UPI000492DC32|nr:YbfB/YjiJ family MFS transporter [Paenibacillus alginolyticus]MCY9668706.1 YbfB/YjiJ family MFS transporter [Paenibacillus alginolyticus]